MENENYIPAEKVVIVPAEVNDDGDDYDRHSDHLSVSTTSTSAFASSTFSNSDYIPIGETEPVRIPSAHRRALRHENNDIRRDILHSLKTDIAAASAKLFVTLKLLPHSTITSKETLKDIHESSRQLHRLQERSNSVTFFGRHVLGCISEKSFQR
ncbi:hypothetical protein RvY_11545 [Ramazzottius varieornatus]|uniref:Uncharacterized protein n=1 Tax=Ramazzottius varieornatus TaxID=947166 RepID=A0A1D1VKT2_RAMVA|nr:hypothetical protein RvY_11545 [Ramazzottius varieornatus]